jgi:hypothetical protein
VATLSYAADLGLGQPMAHCMRQTVIALRLAGLLGASDRELEATYYLGLMMNVYCHADAAEQAQWFGDDIGMTGEGFELLDMSTARMVTLMWRRAGSHGSGMARARRLAAFPVAAPKQMAAFMTTHSTLSSQFAGRIGLWTTRSASRSARPTSSGTARATPITCAGRRSACPRAWCSWPARSRSSAGGTAPRRR